MNKFKSLSEIAGNAQSIESILNEMEGSALNKPYAQLIKFVGGYSGRDLKLSEFYGLAHCVYGWMPRMLVLEEDLNLENLNKEWKSAEGGMPDCTEEKFYQELLKLCGNSIVGLSKLLHFSYPRKYAIIDSNVYKALRLNKKATLPNGLEKRIPLYSNYIKWISEIDEKNEVFEKIKKDSKSLISVSKNRLIEFYLYHRGKLLTVNG